MNSVGSDPFSLVTEHEARVVVVRVRGVLDTVTAPELEQALYGLIDAHPGQPLRLDLQDTTFIDSSGLSVLLRGLRRAQERGGDLALANPRRLAARVLSVTGLDRMFTILPGGG